MGNKAQEVEAKLEVVRSRSGDVPPWLLVMRAITGLHEYEDGSNPKIEAMAAYIGRKFPEQAAYASQYDDDSIAWCGVCTDFCLAACTRQGISGPFGNTDTDKWMWAESFASDPGFIHLGSPVPGCIVVMTREGGGHVTMFEAWDDNGGIRCRGGNQSNCVNVSSYDPDDVIAYVWPKDWPVPEIDVEDRPVLENGDSGPDVVDLQRMIPRFTGEIDGDFGDITEENVRRYQRTRGLEIDGIVGEKTWQALYDNKPPLPPPAPPPGALTNEQRAAIIKIARESWIADYDWEDRGRAPSGYTQGMALAFAQTYLKLKAGHPAAMEMAKARTESDKDALNEYLLEFRELGMHNERDGINTLRHLYALMLGSGMRESSGRYCEGRDLSADNVSSDTCEAGLFQTSYNAHSASDPEFDQLMVEYSMSDATCYLEAFAEGVSCSPSEWDSYGSGTGREFQDLCKSCPAFAVETHALTLRNLCNHYGPIIRHETELKREADEMFKQVQDYMDSTARMA
jgi:uncharacterized protein (TIGR02594 family)